MILNQIGKRYWRNYSCPHSCGDQITIDCWAKDKQFSSFIQESDNLNIVNHNLSNFEFVVLKKRTAFNKSRGTKVGPGKGQSLETVQGNKSRMEIRRIRSAFLSALSDAPR